MRKDLPVMDHHMKTNIKAASHEIIQMTGLVKDIKNMLKEKKEQDRGHKIMEVNI